MKTRKQNAPKGRIQRRATKTGMQKTHKRKRTLGQEYIDRVNKLFQQHPKEIFNYRQVAKEVGAITTPDKQLITQILQAFTEGDVLQEVERGRYRYRSNGEEIIGVFEHSNHGFHCVVPEDGEDLVYVSHRNNLHAMNRDLVRVQLLARTKKSSREGHVVEILERKKTTYVGILKRRGNTAFVSVEERSLNGGIILSSPLPSDVRSGDKVVVRLTDWESRERNPQGELLDVLGSAGENDTEMHAILAEFDLPYTYPEEVEEAARKIPEEIPQEEIAKREDFRDTLTITIDPATAKDFDDALSWKALEDNKLEVGVHIADVSYYVTPDSVIDKEAYKRATSVYLVDRTIPMLPERLCNDLCSLRPNVDRLAYSCVFTLDAAANICDYRIVRSIINSNHRYAYEEAQMVIDKQEGENAEAILSMHNLAQKLREKRFNSGAINFESEEVRFMLNEKGVPVAVEPVVHGTANEMIEEFMLLANKTVATEFATKHKQANGKARTFVYRVHDDPNIDKIQQLDTFVGRLTKEKVSKEGIGDTRTKISSILNKFEGKPESNLIHLMLVRSMARAEYTTENIGHYGLAFPYYTHFTSPIRRYPDLLVHRLTTHYLTNGASVKVDEYEEMSRHCSEQEQIAAKAERESIKYKQVEYMESSIGKVFEGSISGVTQWGIYVELMDSHCEGLVPARLMDDDYYDYDEKNICLKGRRYGTIYTLGDIIKVRVIDTDLNRRQLTFELAE